MQKALKVLVLTTLLFSTFNGCTKQVKKEVVKEVTPADSNRFQTINSRQNRGVGSVDVVCHNCQASFKLSPTIQKMSMKGDAVVDCPVCHKDYLGKH